MDSFPKGARVAFLGDSITAANNFVPRIIGYYLRELPSLQVKFSNAGVSGGSTGSAELYLEPDLFPFKPTHVVIMLGINDSNRNLLDTPDTPEHRVKLCGALENYRIRMNRLCDIFAERGIEVILCTPAPYAEFYVTDQKPLCGGHALILRYAECVRTLARERGLELVDYHARLCELYLDEPLYNPDHVHPNDRGHARMAECFLAAQGLPVRSFAIGQTPEPIIPELTEWCGLTEKIRRIYAVEWMVVGDYALPLDEKMKKIRDYVENERWGNAVYFKTITTAYLENKPCEAEIILRINKIMENLYS